MSCDGAKRITSNHSLHLVLPSFASHVDQMVGDNLETVEQLSYGGVMILARLPQPFILYNRCIVLALSCINVVLMAS